LLQAEQADTPFSFVQSARLIKASGEPIRALQDLEKALEKSSLGIQGDIIDLTSEASPEVARMNAKVFPCLLLD
jgi:serine/threonine-protein kinase ATR